MRTLSRCDAPTAKLIHLAQDPDLPLSVRLATLRELTGFLGKLAASTNSHWPGARSQLDVLKVSGGMNHEHGKID
jgi:hypothetical protein